MTELESQQAKIIELLEEQNRLQAQEIRLLQEKVQALIKLHFGGKSEKLDPNQLQLLLGMEVESREPVASPPEEVGEALKPRKTNRPRRPRIPQPPRKRGIR